MKNLESLKRELVEFTPERFNTVYCNLIDIAQTSDREYEVLDALSFIADCNLMLKQVNETLENLQDETHCPMCEAKEKTIQTAEHLIEQAEKLIKEKTAAIDTLRKQLKVCGK